MRHRKKRKTAKTLIAKICAERALNYIERAVTEARTEAEDKARKKFGKLERDACSALPVARKVRGKTGKASIRSDVEKLADAAIRIAEFADKELRG